MDKLNKYKSTIVIVIVGAVAIMLGYTIYNLSLKVEKLSNEIDEKNIEVSVLKDKNKYLNDILLSKNQETINKVDEIVEGKIGELIDFGETQITLKKVSYSKSFKFKDYNNGTIFNPSAGKGEYFIIFDLTINTKLDPTVEAGFANWEVYNFIDTIKIGKGYSPNSSWGNPHPCKLQVGNDNNIQVAYSINEGDKLDSIVFKDPKSNKRVTIKGES